MRRLKTYVNQKPDVQYSDAVNVPVLPENDQKKQDVGGDNTGHNQPHA